MLQIRPANNEDTPLILDLITELAEYEKLRHEVVATEASLAGDLFSANPKAHVVIAEEDAVPVGFALYFYNYSTFLSRKGLYLEDLFVRPAFRGKGYGKQLLSHLASLAVQEACGRLEWVVLDWNRPAIDFYQSLGAVPMADWTIYRLTGEPLRTLAASARS